MHWHGWLWQEGSSNGLATEVSVSLRVCPSSIDLVLQHLRNHTKKCWWLQSPCAPCLTLWSHRNKRDSISEKQRISTSQKVINQSILCFLMFIRFLISLSSLLLVFCGLIVCGTNLSSLVLSFCALILVCLPESMVVFLCQVHMFETLSLFVFSCFILVIRFLYV